MWESQWDFGGEKKNYKNHNHPRSLMAVGFCRQDCHIAISKARRDPKDRDWRPQQSRSRTLANYIPRSFRSWQIFFSLFSLALFLSCTLSPNPFYVCRFAWPCLPATKHINVGYELYEACCLGYSVVSRVILLKGNDVAR